MKNIITVLMLCAMFTVTLAQSKSKKYNLIVGTYTKPGKSDGIYVYSFDTATGDTKLKYEAKGIKNPTFLSVSANRKFVYAVSETAEGTVGAYAFDPTSGKLTFLNSAPSGGDGPCYVTVDSKNKFVYAGNYGGGNLVAIPVMPNGSLNTKVQVIDHDGKGTKMNQDKPHVHATVLTKGERYLLVPDLGTDKINVYKVDPTKPEPLTPAPVPFIQVDGGNGPRHIAIDKAGKTVYLIQEMTGIITAFNFENGVLSQKQSVTLPVAGFSGDVDAADIHLSSDGRFLYGSLRGDINEIVIFGVDNTGLMTYVGRQSVMGKTPRNFAIDPSGNFLLVGNQNSDEIIIFKRDQKTGLLSPTDKKISLAAPVCLQFVAE